MTTNEQAIESCRRAKSTCAHTFADMRKTLLHYSDNDAKVAATIDELERVTRNALDHKARLVFRESKDLK